MQLPMLGKIGGTGGMGVKSNAASWKIAKQGQGARQNPGLQAEAALESNENVVLV